MRKLVALLMAASLFLLAGCAHLPKQRTSLAPAAGAQPTSLRFLVSFPARAHPQPLSAKVLLLFSGSENVEPRFASSFFNLQPVFAIDVANLHPGDAVEFLPEKFREPFGSGGPFGSFRICQFRQ